MRCVVTVDTVSNISNRKYMNYRPFGDTVNCDGDAERLSYLTEERDVENSYTQLGARTYDPTIGRFLSVDPLFEAFPAWNPYHYCFNNPVGYKDPSGLKPEKEKSEKGNKVQTWYIPDEDPFGFMVEHALLSAIFAQEMDSETIAFESLWDAFDKRMSSGGGSTAEQMGSHDGDRVGSNGENGVNAGLYITGPDAQKALGKLNEESSSLTFSFDPNVSGRVLAEANSYNTDTQEPIINSGWECELYSLCNGANDIKLTLNTTNEIWDYDIDGNEQFCLPAMFGGNKVNNGIVEAKQSINMEIGEIYCMNAGERIGSTIVHEALEGLYAATFYPGWGYSKSYGFAHGLSLNTYPLNEYTGDWYSVVQGYSPRRYIFNFNYNNKTLESMSMSPGLLNIIINNQKK